MPHCKRTTVYDPGVRDGSYTVFFFAISLFLRRPPFVPMKSTYPRNSAPVAFSTWAMILADRASICSSVSV